MYALVAHGTAEWVDVFGWDELGHTVGGDVDLPWCVVDRAVMMATQQNTIGQCGLTAVDPVGDVVALGPARWPVTVREGAAPISQHQGPTDRSAVDATGAAEIQWLALTVADRGQHRRITRQAPYGFGAERLTGVQYAEADRLPQRIEADGEAQLGPVGAAGPCPSRRRGRRPRARGTTRAGRT